MGRGGGRRGGRRLELPSRSKEEMERDEREARLAAGRVQAVGLPQVVC